MSPPLLDIDKKEPPYYPLRSMISRLSLKSLAMAAALAIALIIPMSRFMLVKVCEESMAPTLTDGQWVLVLRGSKAVHPGDIAVFVNPADTGLTVKRCVFDEKNSPSVDHGWLVTRWGRWYLTGPQWDRLESASPPLGEALFMVGDNQFRSFDSRSYGYVPRNSIVGRVLLPNGKNDGR